MPRPTGISTTGLRYITPRIRRYLSPATSSRTARTKRSTPSRTKCSARANIRSYGAPPVWRARNMRPLRWRARAGKRSCSQRPPARRARAWSCRCWRRTRPMPRKTANGRCLTARRRDIPTTTRGMRRGCAPAATKTTKFTSPRSWRKTAVRSPTATATSPTGSRSQTSARRASILRAGISRTIRTCRTNGRSRR